MLEHARNLGLDFLLEDDDTINGLLSYVAQTGDFVKGYYGLPYINKVCGNGQFILRTELTEDGKYNVTGIDVHATSRCVWNVCLSDMNLTPKSADKLERRCAIRNKDGGGLAVVNLVNADVLPCFDDGAEVKLQVTAFPVSIAYYKDEDAYSDDQSEGKDGKKWLVAEGSIFPVGLLTNRNPNSDMFEKDDDMDDLMLVRGTVKELWHGKMDFGEEKWNAFIRCILDTEWGELQIAHTLEDVDEKYHNNLHEGATVSALVRIMADPAIYEYENGMILDEEHDLAILRSTFGGADAERMRYVFSDDAVYVAGYNQMSYIGRDAIIERLNYVSKENENITVFAQMATITDVEEGEPGEEPSLYGAGKRCIVISYKEKEDYSSIAFVDVNEEGRISRLETSIDGRYVFSIDKKPAKNEFWQDVIIPESPITPMVSRARFHGIIGKDVTEEIVLKSTEDDWLYKQNAQRMISSMSKEDASKCYENLFGYLFAKEIERTFVEKAQEEQGMYSDLSVEYIPADARRGEMQTLLSNAQQKKIAAAMGLGKQFFMDFSFFHPGNLPRNESFDADLVQALIVVQRLGKLYSLKCLES